MSKRRTAASTNDDDSNGKSRKKRARVSNSLVVSSKNDTNNNANALIVQEQKRTSELHAPTMLLQGHQSYVYACKFNKKGTHLASASFDKQIFLWNVYGECENICVFSGHVSAVLDVSWSHCNTRLYSASADKSGIVWDVENMKRIRKLRGHKSHVNSICAAVKGEPLMVTGSDDRTVKLWDSRVGGPAQHTFNESYQILSTVLSEDYQQIYAAGIENVINIHDVRMNSVVETLSGHTDTITGLSLDPHARYLISNSMDNTVRQWDIQPYIQEGKQREMTVFYGVRHDSQKNMLRCSWSNDSSHIAAASADHCVYIWDVQSGELKYRLPGHKGSVNCVDFHPNEPILASCSSDGLIYVGEIDIY